MGPKSTSSRKNTNVKIQPELHAKMLLLAALKKGKKETVEHRLETIVNKALEEYMFVTGEGEIEDITGTINPDLPQLPAHVEQESQAANLVMLLPLSKARPSMRDVS